MKRKKCMADGGLIDKANARVKQAVGGIADFLNIGRPATTEVMSGGRTNVPAGQVVAQPDSRADMPQERNPRRFADEVDQRKEARRGGYQQGGLLFDDSATRTNQSAPPGMAAQVSSFLAGVPDAARAPTPQFGPSLAQSAAPVGQTPQSQGLLTGIQDYSTTPAQLANSGRPAFVNEDGTPRNMGAPSPAAQPSPVLTMKERDTAAGVDPNRAYRPGTAADPHASGLRGAAVPAAAGQAGVLDRNPTVQPNLRNWRQKRAGEYADGGIVIPVNIGQGLYQAIAQPIIEDWRQGNVAIKNVRDKYPTADAIAGIHPAVAAAQVANDVMAGNVGGDTAMNVAQAVPMVKGLTGMAKMLSKQGGPTIGGTKFVIDMPGTVRKNMALTAGQTLGQPANAFADGGMVKFAGKGGPRGDQIPVAVAGNEINVSDGEAAVILPAKTAANAAALGIIGGLIEATNDGRKPKMGMRDGGKYARGAVPDEEELRRSQGVIGGPAFVRSDASRPSAKPITAPEMYAPAYEAAANVPAAAGGIASTIMNALPEGGYLKDPAFREKAGRLISGEGMFTGGLTGSANAPRQVASQQPVLAQPQPVIGNEGRGSAITSINAVPASAPAAQPQDSGATTRNSIVQTDMGRGFDPTKLQMAPGYGMASNAAGKTLSVGPSQYVAADGSQTSRWEDTQQYKDAIARNEADKTRLAEMQSRRLGADPMAIQAARQGIASAVLGNQAKQAEMQRNEYIQSLVAKAAAETDPVKQRAAVEAALAAQGKSGRQVKNLHVVDLGEDTVTDQTGAVQTVKRGQAIYDADTGRVVPIGAVGQVGGVAHTAQRADEIKAQMQAGKLTREQAIAELRKIGYQ